jgi:hypothetical protein
MLRKVVENEDTREIVASGFRGLWPRRREVLDGVELDPVPYIDLGRGSEARPIEPARRPILVTARFRSGSTLLWNIFRQVPGCTAFYEPLNERCWFDPATRGERIDPTHRCVDDYWREYDGLQALAAYYHRGWFCRHLLMDAEFVDPDLEHYLGLLIHSARGRAVLQCNRVDFRLAWLRRHFPELWIVHLYRHPRDQWCSSLMDLARYTKDDPIERFAPHDKFYLLMWARDLRHVFPFLDERRVDHAYQLSYYLWRLSYAFAHRNADYSLSFEDLVDRPESTLGELFSLLGIAGEDLRQAQAVVEKPQLGRWREYASDSWFQRHEATCEQTLKAFFQS